MKRLVIAFLLFSLSNLSYAGHCPADAKAIDEGLAKVTLAEDVKAQVMALRDKGMSEHNAGEHGAAVNTMAEATRLLLTNME